MAYMQNAHKQNTSDDIVRLNPEQSELLLDLASSNDYWNDVQEFISNKEGNAVCSLTPKQREWYYNILAGLDREIDKEEARKAFDDSEGFV